MVFVHRLTPDQESCGSRQENLIPRLRSHPVCGIALVVYKLSCAVMILRAVSVSCADKRIDNMIVVDTVYGAGLGRRI